MSGNSPMGVRGVLTCVAWIIMPSVSLPAVDLRTIDRAILKEPAYRTGQPKFCLAVFGPKAETRVWMVLDGDRLFIDRNGNLDLTEAGENVKGEPSPKGHGEVQFNAGTITAKDGVLPNTRLEVLVVPELTFVYCRVEKQPWQRAVVDNEGYLAFANKPQTAPVLHFQGPLTIDLRFDHKTGAPAPGGIARTFFKRHSGPEDLDIMVGVGTPGVGAGSFVRFGHETVAKDIRPVLEIDFPSKDARMIHVKTTLDKRC